MQSSGVASHRADKSRGMRQSEGFLKKIDLFASTPEILYRGSTSCGSNFGGLVTLIWGTLYLLVTFFVTWRYIDRGQPQSNSSNFYMKDPEGFRLDNDTLPFALGLQNSSGLHFIDPRIYNITATHHKWSKYNDENGKLITKRVNTNLSLIPCNQLSLDQSAFANLDLSSMLCLENLKTKQHDLQITGLFESSVYGYISFRISRCRGPTCKPDAEIEATLKNCFFAVNYRTFEMRTSEFNDPIAPIPASFYTATSTTFSKQVTLRMANNQLVTENSFIPYATPDTKSFVTDSRFQNEIAAIYTTYSSTDYLMSFAIRMDPTLIVTQRSYRSLYQYIAEFGGLSQILAALGFLLTNRYRHLFLKFDFARFSRKRSSTSTRTDEYNVGSPEGLRETSLGLRRNNSSDTPPSSNGGNPRKIPMRGILKKGENKFDEKQPQSWDADVMSETSKPNPGPQESEGVPPPVKTSFLEAPTTVSSAVVIPSASKLVMQSELSRIFAQDKIVAKSDIQKFAKSFSKPVASLKLPQSNFELFRRSNPSTPSDKNQAGSSSPNAHSLVEKLDSARQPINTTTVTPNDAQAGTPNTKDSPKTLSEWDFFLYWLARGCVPRDKRTVVQQAVEGDGWAEEFDLFRLVQTVRDVDRLKRTIFTPQQLSEFEEGVAAQQYEQ